VIPLAPRGLHELILMAVVNNGWVCMLIATALVSKSTFLFDLQFSLRKFYVLMGWAPLAFLVLGLAVDTRYFLLFVVTGIAGILGELLVSVMYRWFFGEPIWTYSYRSLLGGYTSSLNFLPWAVGAFLFHASGRLLGGPAPSGNVLVSAMTISTIAYAVGLAIVFPLRALTTRDPSKPRRFTKASFALFCFPILLVSAALAIWSEPRFAILMLAFGPIGFATEYSYGRSMSFLFERGLWIYNHWKIDSGHTSFVTLPLWALGGLYFYFISACLGL
jgi:hypothetical protein